jgi:hypothetical protein
MANVDIRVGKKNAAFFAANPTLVLKDGQFIFNSDTSELFIGDGVTQLSSLVAINGASYTLTTSEIGSVINAATTATPNDTDLVISVDSSVAKKNTWTQIKTFLKTYFDSIYTTTSAVASQISSALSGYVNTSGLTTNYIPKASDSDTLGNSQIQDNGTNIGIGANPQSNKTLLIQGKAAATGTNAIEVNSLVLGNIFSVEDFLPRVNVGAGYTTDPCALNLGNNSATQGFIGFGSNANLGKIYSASNAGVIVQLKNIDTGNNDIFMSTDPASLVPGNAYVSASFRHNVQVGSNNNSTDLFSRFFVKGLDSTSSNNCALFVNSSNAEILKLRNDRAIIIDSLTANRILELDANKVVISAAKNSGYNLALGTTAGTVAEGNDTRITQAVRTIYKDFTTGAALTGTTSMTLINSALISANTVAVGNEVEVKFRAQRNTATGVASNYLYFNTSASLSGATLIGGVSSANAYFASVRTLFVKSPTDSETVSSSANLSSSDVGAVPTTTITSLNIDWTANVHIIQAFQNAANGDSTTSRGMIIKLS